MPTLPVPVPFFTVKEFAFLFGVTSKVIIRRIRSKNKARKIKVLPGGYPYKIPLSEYDRCKEGVFVE